MKASFKTKVLEDYPKPIKTSPKLKKLKKMLRDKKKKEDVKK